MSYRYDLYFKHLALKTLKNINKNILPSRGENLCFIYYNHLSQASSRKAIPLNIWSKLVSNQPSIFGGKLRKVGSVVERQIGRNRQSGKQGR
jgi:hypothetical protein